MSTVLENWEPQHAGTLRDCPRLYRDCLQCDRGASECSILEFTVVWDILTCILHEFFDVSEEPFSIYLHYVLFCIVSCPCDKNKNNLIGGVFGTHGKEERCVQGFGGKT